MRVRFIAPYFPPEVGAAQTRLYELAVRLQKLGHEVSVLTTFPNYPSGIVPPEWRGKLFWRGDNEGVKIYRVWSYVAPNRGFTKRILAQLAFVFFASVAGLFLPHSDIAIVESPPLFDGFIGLFLRVLRGMPYTFMVSDLWPESAVQLGVLRNRFLIRASKAIELLFYRQAALMFALTAGIREGIIADRVEPSKVVLFRNSVDCGFFRPVPGQGSFRAQLGVHQATFLAVYAGTLGLAQNLTTILDAAFLFKTQGQENVQFLLAGDGAESDVLKETAKARGLDNVKFLTSVPKSQMPELLNAADCVIVPLRDLELFRGALPTKLFEALACAKPVVLGIRGEAEELIQAADAGYCVPPEVPSAICDAVLALMKNPQRACEMGENGRRYVQQHFSRDARALQLSDALQAAALRRVTVPVTENV